MQAFDFQTVRQVHFGEGAAKELAQHLDGLGSFAKVLVVSDTGVTGAGLLEAPLGALQASGKKVHVFDGVCADPPCAMVEAAVRAARAFAPDCVVGIGGGSTMDTAKLVALLCATEQKLTELYGIDRAAGPRLPLVLMPTTAGTGSEVTPISVVTGEGGEKLGIVSSPLYADLALLDPVLTLSLPRAVTAATGMDAMVHAIEALTSARLKNPLSDDLGLAALRRLHGAMERVCTDGNDLEARGHMLLGAMQAGQAFANAPVGAIHALAYPVGGRFHVPHGLSNALVMAHVMRFNLPEAAPVYAHIHDALGLGGHGNDAARAGVLIDELERLCDAIGLQRRLSQVGIGADDLAAMADEAITIERLLLNNPRVMSRDDILSVYEAAL